jgi:hypothetical protein
VGGVLGLVGPGVVLAEGPFEGTWQASPMRVRVAVESWGSDCGRRPPTTSTEPGGTVRIGQSGTRLFMKGAMEWATDRCFTPNQAARRQTATAEKGNWKVTCRTPPDDSRAERGTYTLRATGPETLVFREESRYDWELKSSRCLATRVAERTLTRERATGAPPEPPTAPPPGRDPNPPACTPGPAARLLLSPARSTIEPGDRVCFRARVVDTKGCPLPEAAVDLELTQPEALAGTMRGRCFHSGESAAESEGTFRVVATSGRLSGHADIQVRAVDLSDLIARGTLEPKPEGDRDQDAEWEEASRVAARTDESAGLLWPIMGAAAALLMLLGTAIVMVVRRRGPPPSPMAPSGAAPIAAPPTGDGEAPPGSGAGAGAGAPAPGGEQTPDTHQSMICPACRRGYGPGSQFCPHDSEALVPYATFRSQQDGPAGDGQGQGRICPNCGERYGPDRAFCGKDGARLVRVN